MDDCSLYSGAKLRDSAGRVTWTNEWQTPGCSLEAVTVNVGSNRKYTVANI